MARMLALLYGLACYVLFFVTFLYAIGFVTGLFGPTALDAPPSTPPVRALAIDAGLLALFAVQHSVMARQGFKRAWTRLVPRPVERSTFVLFASLVLLLMFWQWQPIGGGVWDVRSPAARAAVQALALAGWLTVLISTFLIDHADLFGLRQVFLYFRGQAYRPPDFRATALYRYVRHPIYLGFLIAFWAAPTMTLAHLLFAVATTGYILIAIQLEERDLLRFHGPAYEAYRKRVSMLVPRSPRR
jgi:methanethiol S-methyltransferase